MSPPTIVLKPAPIVGKTPRDRVLIPTTVPMHSSTRYPGISKVVAVMMPSGVSNRVARPTPLNWDDEDPLATCVMEISLLGLGLAYLRFSTTADNLVLSTHSGQSQISFPECECRYRCMVVEKTIQGLKKELGEKLGIRTMFVGGKAD